MTKKTKRAVIEASSAGRIDAAVARIRAFVTEHPEKMLLVEDIGAAVDPKSAFAKVVGGGSVEHALAVHSGDSEGSVGRWHRKGGVAKLDAADLRGKSVEYAYFLTRYGSLTWLIHEDGLGEEYGFTSANTAGSGNAVMMIPLAEDSELGQQLIEDAEEDEEDDDNDDDSEDSDEEEEEEEEEEEDEDEGELDPEVQWRANDVAFDDWLDEESNRLIEALLPNV